MTVHPGTGHLDGVWDPGSAVGAWNGLPAGPLEHGEPGWASRNAQAVCAAATAQAHPRAGATTFFDRLEIIEPGVVDVRARRAEPQRGWVLLYSGVARKP